MQGVVKKWGSSAAVRIPTSVLRAAKVSLGQCVAIRAEKGRIMVEPFQPLRYDIEAMVAGITEENRHEPVKVMSSADQEAW